MKTRQELLEKLYWHIWMDMETLESDNPRYAYVSYDDLEVQDEICSQIEMTDHERGV
jgi:hypothetical protein